MSGEILIDCLNYKPEKKKKKKENPPQSFRCGCSVRNPNKFPFPRKVREVLCRWLIVIQRELQLPINILLFSLINPTLNTTAPMPAQINAKVPILAREFLQFSLPSWHWLNPAVSAVCFIGFVLFFCFVFFWRNYPLPSRDGSGCPSRLLVSAGFFFPPLISAEKSLISEKLHFFCASLEGLEANPVFHHGSPAGRLRAVQVRARAPGPLSPVAFLLAPLLLWFHLSFSLPSLWCEPSLLGHRQWGNRLPYTCLGLAQSNPPICFPMTNLSQFWS